MRATTFIVGSLEAVSKLSLPNRYPKKNREFLLTATASHPVLKLPLVTFGVLYSFGYFSERLRDELSDHVPMYPAPVGIAVLFVIGASVGISFALAFMPTELLKNKYGRELMDEFVGSQSPQALRRYGWAGLIFMLSATIYALWYVFVYLRD